MPLGEMSETTQSWITRMRGRPTNHTPQLEKTLKIGIEDWKVANCIVTYSNIRWIVEQLKPFKAAGDAKIFSASNKKNISVPSGCIVRYLSGIIS